MTVSKSAGADKHFCIPVLVQGRLPVRRALQYSRNNPEPRPFIAHCSGGVGADEAADGRRYVGMRPFTGTTARNRLRAIGRLHQTSSRPWPAITLRLASARRGLKKLAVHAVLCLDMADVAARSQGEYRAQHRHPFWIRIAGQVRRVKLPIRREMKRRDGCHRSSWSSFCLPLL